MKNYGLEFHHLGLAVKEPSTAKSFLKGLGYNVGQTVFDPEQNVNLLMCDHQTMPAVEIIFPAKGPGPLDKVLSDSREGLVYHMCFRTKNLEASLVAMKSDFSIHMVADRKAAVLLGGKYVSFYLVRGMGLIEILEGT